MTMAERERDVALAQVLRLQALLRCAERSHRASLTVGLAALRGEVDRGAAVKLLAGLLDAMDEHAP